MQDNGKPFSTNRLWKVFNKAREDHPEVAGVPHGLRANAVIHLRQNGYSIAQISDMVGMSPPVVERYSRHADRKAGGQAVLLALKQGPNKNRTVKS
jgi:integrase